MQLLGGCGLRWLMVLLVLRWLCVTVADVCWRCLGWQLKVLAQLIVVLASALVGGDDADVRWRCL